MKILLIAPSSGSWSHVGYGKLLHGKTFRFSLLSLLSVAAQTPAEHDIAIVDEQHEDIPWGERFDLIGITCMTATAPRAYEIAAQFRRMRIPVVLGGFHPTLCPEEASRHADAIVVGDAEGAWPLVLRDAMDGTLRGSYRSPHPVDLSNLPPPRYDLLSMYNYSTYAVQATRGCAHRCSFCSVSAFHQRSQRRRPANDVVREIERIPGSFFIFVDDNLMQDREFAMELFTGMIPLKKRWAAQSTLALAHDEELLQCAAEAGCMGIFAGLETFSNQNLDAVDKEFHRVDQYKEAAQTLHSHGIGVEAGIVLGFDHDRPETFQSTLDRMEIIGVDAAQFSILTPMPGTALHRAAQGRIFDRDWNHYDFHHAVFHPKHMDAAALQNGHDWITRQFYTPARILKRMARWTRRPNGWKTLPYMAAINWAYYGRVQSWGIGRHVDLRRDVLAGQQGEFSNAA